MKHFSFTIFISIISFSSYTQTIQQIDSVAAKMCESLSGIKDIKDDVQVTLIFQKHLPDFYRRFNLELQSVADSIKDKVYYRLQRNCPKFVDILNNLEENKSDWIQLKQKPKISISKKSCNTVFKGGNFYYKEFDGKIVNVVINSNTWTETFEDNTKSKLIIHPKNNCEFDLEFIESTNDMRKNFSVKGDIYNYGMYELNDGIFNVWVLSKGDNVIYGFKIYSKK